MVRGVDKEILAWIDYRRRTLPPMRVFYDEILKQLIVKLVSDYHEILHQNLMNAITAELQNMGITMQYYAVQGAGRVRSQNSREKEPDNSFRPINTRPKFSDLPTFVIEVGVSKTLNNPRNDAFFWLTQTNDRVKIVLLIHSSRDHSIATRPLVITMEVWQTINNPRPHRANSAARPRIPVRTQTVTITRQGNGPPVTTGAPLLLPVNVLFESVPPFVTQSDVSLPAVVLEMYANIIFNSLP
ncbi:hypothetical protein DTO021D3_2508 [Paecilomyces variotii]|nr:hypothetical protein DTO032I3_3064 [Paecilomyces variotii]KAJ9280658.1 hypothetical protein DTO021D3_2508 [Paecilomyces variotii]KAJ9346269.1 hypothetical protein DTO027B6_1122 [Paecilomyces variotii]KAJ9391664.1 hypothetical protein DTO032I4_1099 [Paecilomyces variotii]KAJ9404061.1 hypothetical protein DTO045G8_8183 [Paecilomyces variotii]